MKTTDQQGTEDQRAHDEWIDGEGEQCATTTGIWHAALAWERARNGWRPASLIPFPNNPKSTIVPVIATVELPDDPFKPGHPYRVVFFSGWWDIAEAQWYFQGYPKQDEVKVIAWMPDINPFLA